jgi:mannose-6-phosphate isomerase-like protein (cupin superfamily)
MELFVDVHARAEFARDKMRKNNLFTTPRLFCDVYCFEAGQEQAGHSHGGSDKIYHVLSGRGRISVGDDTRTVGPGTAVLAPAGAAHSVHNPGPERLLLLVIMAPKP